MTALSLTITLDINASNDKLRQNESTIFHKFCVIYYSIFSKKIVVYSEREKKLLFNNCVCVGELEERKSNLNENKRENEIQEREAVENEENETTVV